MKDSRSTTKTSSVSRNGPGAALNSGTGSGHQQDIIERVELYEKSVRRIVVSLRKNLGPRVVDRKLWHSTRRYFGQRLYNVPDAGFLKTFFNSTTRRIFNTVGTDPEIEFVSSAPDEGFNPLETLTLNRYPYWGSLDKTFKKILEDFTFKVPYRNISYRYPDFLPGGPAPLPDDTCGNTAGSSGLNLSTRHFFNRPAPT